MGTFRDFLLENAQTPEMVAKTILEQAMPYVNASGGVDANTILYRGSDAKIADFVPHERNQSGGVTGNYSGDRGQMLRDYFNNKCGVDIDRIIFATADASLAKTFGNPYVIFPIGDFKFIYSKAGVPIPHIENEKDLERADFVCGIADDNSDDGLPDPDFINALNSDNEILIASKGYLPISLSYWKENQQAILEELFYR